MARGKRERPREKWFWREYRQHPWGVALLALVLAFGLSGVITYHIVSEPAKVQVVQTPGPTVTATPHIVVTHHATHHPAVRHSASTPSPGYANVPGVTPYYQPTTPTPTPTAQSRAPPTPTPTPTLTPTTEVPTSAPPDTGSPSASVTFPTSPF